MARSLEQIGSMISTFDLTLLGALVSAGGIMLLRQGKWPHIDVHFSRTILLTAESRERHERSTALAGVRWLTVGGMTLLISYVHGADEGYLFGPWADVMFHLVFVSTCLAATLNRIHQTAQRVSSS
jgi:hypothetical protein